MEKFKTIKGKNHYLYSTIGKFKLLYPEYGDIKHWRFGNTDDWVLTDDDCVVQVLRRGVIARHSGKTCYYVRTVCGSFRIDKEKEMYGQIAENIYTFSGVNEYKRFLKKPYCSEREVLFSQYVASGRDPVDTYLDIYKTENSKYAKNMVGRLLKTDRIKTMIKEEIKEVLQEEGISPNYIVRRFKQVADEGSKDGDVLRSLESLAKICGLFDSQEQKQQQLTVWSGFSPEQLDGVKNEQVLLHGELEKDA